jgi:hypothetical protein
MLSFVRICIALLLLTLHALHAAVTATCSRELSILLAADQRDRVNFKPLSSREMNAVIQRDLVRQKRVSALYATGCFKTAADYTAAALIYQHGDTSKQYYQAFLWARRAVALGDVQQKKLVAMTLDRYLISLGKKQLFGSQFEASSTTGWCVCLQPVEASFPDAYRAQYLQEPKSVQYQSVHRLNRGKKQCKDTLCPHKLLPTPRGSVPGIW